MHLLFMYTTFGLGIIFLVGLALGYIVRHVRATQSATSFESRIKVQQEESRVKARELILEAKDRAAVVLEEVQKQEREIKSQIARTEDRLLKKEELIDRQVRDLRTEESRLSAEQARLKTVEVRVTELQTNIQHEFERVAQMTIPEARAALLQKVQGDHARDLVQAIQKLETERRDELEKKSLEIITTAMQRYARTHVAEVTTSIFTLPNEDLKGKIIGREGRNIRTLERLTGVEFVVDESPESILISSFDPLRREIARLALEKLVKDGRIQPVKIEEKVEEARSEIEKRMQEIGESAAYELGILDLPKELITLLGRLHFRTSYGQNVLAHSIEMAHLAGMIAAELHANVDVAKRGALLHDIGKAMSHEVEGTHVELGRKILQKYNIPEPVIAAMQSHHEEYPFSTPESFIVTAVDALSAARPGARRDTLEHYIKRLGDLEKIASSFPGVKQAYALSAGREIRVFVVPEKIDDFGALQLAKDIATKVQVELKYPGEIKVNVIREIRAVEYAR